MTLTLIDPPEGQAMIGTATILRGDARNLPLPDNSVDLVVTSPPYFALRSYQDGGEHYDGQIGAEATPAEFVDALLEVTRECVRVLKPSGSLWVNLGDKYAGHTNGTGGHRALKRTFGTAGTKATGAPTKSLLGIPWRYALRCIDDLGLILRAEVIWSKPNGLPESVTDRVRRSHEQWFHFTLEPRYFSAVDEIREAHNSVTWIGREKQERSNSDRNDGGKMANTANPLGKLPGSVRTVPTEPLRVPDHLGVDHFAAFPTAWPKWIIQGWAPTEPTAPTRPAVILDPFGGTGTTALVAKALGCHGISVDMSADYCRLAEWRTNDPAQLAKVLELDKPPEVAPDQDVLFDVPGNGGGASRVSVSLQGDRTCASCGYRSQYARKSVCDRCGARRDAA